MNQIIEDMKIILDRNVELNPERFFLNNGTSILSAAEANNLNYLQNCFIPTQEWRKVNSVELEQLTSIDDLHGNWDLGGHIGIITIPEYLIQPLREIIRTIDIDLSHLRDGMSKVTLHPNYQYAIQAIRAHLQQYTLMTNDEIKTLGIHCSKPQLITTTVNTIKYLPRQPYVGLHLDSWENSPLKRRHLSSNRICINIGQENRYFLMINLSLMKIFHLLGLSTISDISKHYRGVKLPSDFMLYFPTYPVMKMTLAPNEAYIAPTENIIHDSSTLDKQELDFSLTFLGKFGILH
ncbi:MULTISPECIES: hypothetical protein [unclassified Anabaena]|uniref:hypothetical protein n=1 Tax=unclassified Anabaena TaxID=2619674 RepID=UPI002B216A6A|nr:hypothetical protein [Anabaena sp. UHCC 0399]MEA5569103.1 hypothetical protein [Anabaena sp. UHCC 0399]